ncbi:MAG: serine/threonine-protein kinase [Polyangiaceae bacterium]|nr:serine/threonine-protein kinase [Polyangiaceae bacterium]
MSEPLVGAIVDTRYELRRLIAHGGMGLVFEAHHRFTRRTVVIKLLPEANRPNKEARGRLLREAHALAAVRHTGMVEVLDAGVCAENGPYLVLEMLEGRTLDGILAARQHLSIADTVQIGRQICDAMAYAHARGVIHRDLKPSNVFVARTEVGVEAIKLIDLGVAALSEEQLAQLDRKLTSTHEVLGTPEYMAPEQLWGRPIDARTDVYAIGISLFQCLTGEVPYVGTYPDVLVQVSHAEEPPRVRDVRPDVSPALAKVIEQALEKEPESRFRSTGELGRALVAASGLLPAPTQLLGTSAEDPPPSTPRVETEDEPDAQEIKLVRKKAPRADGTAGVAPDSPPRRRQFLRAPYTTPVFLLAASGHRPVEARSEEISEEGMLVVSPVTFALGVRLTLRFASPVTGEILVAPARVRWAREGRGKSALGLEFEGVAQQIRQAVIDYIGSLGVGPDIL